MPRKRKEVEHLHVGNQAVRPFEESLNGGHGHAAHGIKEQSQQDVLQAAQGDIEPARQAPIAVKSSLAEPPQPFGNRAYRTKPRPEAFAQQPGDRQKGEEQEHSGRMHVGDVARRQQDLQVHQRGDGQPTFDSGRSRDPHPVPTRFVVVDEQNELRSDPQI